MKAFYPLLFATLLIMNSCTNNDTSSGDQNPGYGNSSVQKLSYSVVATYPHDTSSFTQGLEFYNNQLLEGTGMENKSKLMQVDLQTGKPVKEVKLDPKLFGEGITILNDTLYQLTWQNKVVLVYDAKSFKKIKEVPIDIEGWGITNDGKNLIVSNGSSNLYFFEPATFKLLRTQSVTEDGAPAIQLNELEFINGYVYANQWQYNYILKIEPESGLVVGKLDFTDLVNRVQAKIPNLNTGTEATLNGIAYNPQSNKIYITGKYWPELYEVQFEH